MSRTVFIDISSSMNNVARRVSGIQRVELEVALQLSEELRVVFLRHDGMSRRFVVVPEQQVRQRHQQLVAEPTESGLVPPASATQSVVARVGSRVAAHIPDRFIPGWLLKIGWVVEQQSLKASSTFHRLRLRSGRVLRRWLHRDDSAALRDRFPGGAPGDLLLCLTFHYDPRVFEELINWVRCRGLEFIFTVYDLIPSLVPQYSTLDPRVFDANLRAVVDAATRILTISQCSASDIRAFCARERLVCPPIDVLRLASAVTTVTPRRPALEGPLEDFVLCVGTIEPRKNHQVLLDVWEEFARDRIDEAPALVIAGSVGWLNAETMQRLHAAAELRHNVVFVDAPTDHELHWLYRNCAFTVFPSHYEGWGLPVTESLDAGKICITTDRGSLREAGEGLVIHLDPIDRGAWRDTILDLHRNRERLARLEGEVRSAHVRRPLGDVAAELRRVIG